MSTAVTIPVPGLTRYAGQEEPQAEANKGVDSSNNPQRGSNDPGGLVENSSDHSCGDNESETSDGPYLSRHKRQSGNFDWIIPLTDFRFIKISVFRAFLPWGSFLRRRATGASHTFPEQLGQGGPLEWYLRRHRIHVNSCCTITANLDCALATKLQSDLAHSETTPLDVLDMNNPHASSESQSTILIGMYCFT